MKTDTHLQPLLPEARRGGVSSYQSSDRAERQRTEQALRESEERFRALVETTSDWVWAVDQNAFYTYASPKVTELLGYEPKEVIGKTPFDLMPPEEAERIARVFGDIARSRRPFAALENVNLHKDGHRVVLETSGVPILDAAGNLLGYRGIDRDITERKRAEQALREAQETLERRVQERTAELQASHQALAESEDKFRRLFAAVTDAIVVFDAQTRQFVEVNDATLQLYGYTRDEFLRLKHPAITAEPEDSYASIRLTLASSMTRIPLRYHKKKDGTVFPVEISASTFLLKGRTVLCGIIRDITARKQAEEALRRREQELADFFAESPLGLLWVGPNGHILRANEAELELLGRRCEEIRGWHVAELHADFEAATELLGRLAKKETVQNYRARLRQKDGSIRQVLIDANGLWEADQLVHSRWFVRDITRRLELEREILSISEREHRRLGHDLHDDLCQQLAGIEFLSQTLAGDLAARSAAGAAQAKEIAQMTQHAMRHTRELARGLSPVRLEAEGLMDALRGLAAQTKKVFRRDCRFRCEAPVLVPDHTVAIHLYRIAQEAVGNAIKHSKARRITLALAARGDSLILEVNDNGIGLPRTTRKAKGMGLRIMRYRAGVIGGTLAVERAPLGGTSVKCTVKEGLLPPEARNTT